MKKSITTTLFVSILLFNSNLKSFAWGKTGHGLVAEVAFKFLDSATQKIVKKYLGNLTIEEAANWMDEQKGNSYYNYMRSWHYLDIDKGKKYEPSSERNVMSVIHSAIAELKNRHETEMSDKEIKYRILLLFHLVGDMHQPLHTGYAIDKGGNTIQVSSSHVSGNLHSVWDTQILEYKGINLDTCMQYYATLKSDEIASIKKINELKWMYESRSYLDQVYDFENNFLDDRYLDKNVEVIKRQLVVGGLRLGSILNELFNPDFNKKVNPDSTY
jgi:hypothetical protein